MKRFLNQILLVAVLPVILILGIFEYTLRSAPNDYALKDEWMTKNTDVRILSFGSSHAYYGIRPQYFNEKAFNLAFTSQSLKYDHYLYHKYVPLCDSLEYIILPISYFTLRQNMDGGAESWRIKGYCIYMDCDYYAYDISKNLEISSKDKLNSIFDVLFRGKTFLSCDSLGWGVNYSYKDRAKDWQASGVTAADRHTKTNKEMLDENISYLEDMIEDTKKRGIEVILLTTPTFYTYRDNLDEAQLHEMVELCDNLAHKYDHVSYLNWLQHDSFIEDDFFDADHLNEYGAEKLSKLLNDYIWKLE